jgi:hypothetical protein
VEHDDATHLRLARKILAYFDDHPDAQDATEGIEWWLGHGVKSFDPELDLALQALVRDGLVLKHEGPDGRSSYRLNQDRRGEVRVRLGRSEQTQTHTVPDQDQNRR